LVLFDLARFGLEWFRYVLIWFCTWHSLKGPGLLQLVALAEEDWLQGQLLPQGIQPA
jgi:hypothetical protein